MVSESGLYDEIDDKKFLYRFIGLDNFMNIILSKSLVFVKPTLWEDPRELGVLKIMLTKAIDKKRYEVKGPIVDFNSFKRLLELDWIASNLYAQCWTTLEESDALWRIYFNEGKAIRISVKIDILKQIEEIVPVSQVFICV